MISEGVSHALAVLVSILTANGFYEIARSRFPGMDGAITYWVSPVLERLNLSMPVHTAGLLVMAMAIGFVVGMLFRLLRQG